MQEKEYKEALEAFNKKHKEKIQLISRLMEVTIIYKNFVLIFIFGNILIC